MNGFERLQEQVKDQEDMALKQTVEYLLSREDMEQKYLKEEKTLEGMCKFIKSKGTKHLRNGWNYITNEVVYAWAIMYFSLPDKFLKIDTPTNKQETKKENTKQKAETKNNIVSLEDAKKQLENKKQVEQLTLFGGVAR